MNLVYLFAAISSHYELPAGLLESICYVESEHKISIVNQHDGGSKSLGLCQVKINTARMLGFKGTEKELMLPVTNITYAALYLKKQLNRYNNVITKGVSAYNAGRYKTCNRKYVETVMKVWRSNNDYCQLQTTR